MKWDLQEAVTFSKQGSVAIHAPCVSERLRYRGGGARQRQIRGEHIVRIIVHIRSFAYRDLF